MDRDVACDDGVAAGKTCSAECAIDYGWSGEGYTATCKSDGSWSTPSGSCADDYGGSGKQCYNDCQVANCNNCVCGEDDVTGDTACQCNARQGFTEWSYT
jgi:hypothetical protein